MRVWVWNWRWWYVVAILEAFRRKVPNLNGPFPGRLQVMVTGAEINDVIIEIKNNSLLRHKLFWRNKPCFSVESDGQLMKILRDVEVIRKKEKSASKLRSKENKDVNQT